jgi:hypothetical protein
MADLGRQAAGLSRTERSPVSGSCPECGAAALARYPVVSEGGWFEVVKCQECLASVARTRWSRLGWVSRLEDTL